jgi:hypothetical protein
VVVTELSIQRALRGGETPAALEARLGIKSRAHKDYANLVLFKYGPGADFREETNQEARGIILDANKDWAVVCWGYRKFHNHGEALAAPIEWSTARVWEKLDGSLMQVYHYDGKWHVATSGTPDGATDINGKGTFADLFWTTLRSAGYDVGKFDRSRCYMFELVAPENRVVVRYPQAMLFLHGVRNRVSLREEDPEMHARSIGIPDAGAVPARVAG